MQNAGRMARIVAVAGLVAAGCFATGCEVETHKSGEGKDVKIATPFGGMRVKTDNADVMGSLGLPAYPGAEPVKKEKDSGSGSADVNMSFGGFQLRVKAISYRTGDAPVKVEAFYREGLKRFGDVIACRDDRPVGKPTQTAEGLTCDNMKENHITVDDSVSHGKLELKAGSKVHQHLVEIDPEGSGTKFGLVALDLPGKMFSDKDESGDKQ